MCYFREFPKSCTWEPPSVSDIDVYVLQEYPRSELLDLLPRFHPYRSHSCIDCPRNIFKCDSATFRCFLCTLKKSQNIKSVLSKFTLITTRPLIWVLAILFYKNVIHLWFFVCFNNVPVPRPYYESSLHFTPESKVTANLGSAVFQKSLSASWVFRRCKTGTANSPRSYP